MMLLLQVWREYAFNFRHLTVIRETPFRHG